MKVFISGSQGLTNLVDMALEKFKEYQLAGAELLVSDKEGFCQVIQKSLQNIGYEKVCVYSRGDVLNEHSAEWESRTVKPRFERDYYISQYQYHLNPYHHISDEDFAMEQDADTAFIIWNGKDHSTFLNIINFVSHSKPLEVQLTEGNRLISINSVDDVRQLIPSKQKEYTPMSGYVPQHMYASAVEQSVPSKEMRTFLLGNQENKYNLRHMILHSPVSLKVKYDLCKELCKTDNLFQEMLDALAENEGAASEGVEGLYYERYKNFKYSLLEIEEVLSALELKQSEELRLIQVACARQKADGRSVSRSDDVREHIGVFDSYDAAIRFIQSYTENWPDDVLTYLVLEKWCPIDGNTIGNTYSYYFVKNSLSYYSKNKLRQDGSTWYPSEFALTYSTLNVNLHMPFKPGDILKIDCTPFAPVTYAVMLERSGNRGNRGSARALFREPDGKWNVQWLNSYHPYRRPSVELSPLYKLTTYDGELPEHYQFMKTIQQEISFDEEVAYKLLNHLLVLEDEKYSRGISEDKFISFWNTNWKEVDIPDQWND